MNPISMLIQLFTMAPPYSAFVDFLCVKVSKKYRSSPADFYWQIFREKK